MRRAFFRQGTIYDLGGPSFLLGGRMIVLVLASGLGAILGANFTVGAVIPILLGVVGLAGMNALFGGDVHFASTVLLLVGLQIGYVAGAGMTFLIGGVSYQPRGFVRLFSTSPHTHRRDS